MLILELGYHQYQARCLLIPSVTHVQVNQMTPGNLLSIALCKELLHYDEV